MRTIENIPVIEPGDPLADVPQEWLDRLPEGTVIKVSDFETGNSHTRTATGWTRGGGGELQLHHRPANEGETHYLPRRHALVSLPEVTEENYASLPIGTWVCISSEPMRDNSRLWERIEDTTVNGSVYQWRRVDGRDHAPLNWVVRQGSQRFVILYGPEQQTTEAPQVPVPGDVITSREQLDALPIGSRIRAISDHEEWYEKASGDWTDADGRSRGSFFSLNGFNEVCMVAAPPLENDEPEPVIAPVIPPRLVIGQPIGGENAEWFARLPVGTTVSTGTGHLAGEPDYTKTAPNQWTFSNGEHHPDDRFPLDSYVLHSLPELNAVSAAALPVGSVALCACHGQIVWVKDRPEFWIGYWPGHNNDGCHNDHFAVPVRPAFHLFTTVEEQLTEPETTEPVFPAVGSIVPDRAGITSLPVGATVERNSDTARYTKEAPNRWATSSGASRQDRNFSPNGDSGYVYRVISLPVTTEPTTGLLVGERVTSQYQLRDLPVGVVLSCTTREGARYTKTDDNRWTSRRPGYPGHENRRNHDFDLDAYDYRIESLPSSTVEVPVSPVLREVLATQPDDVTALIERFKNVIDECASDNGAKFVRQKEYAYRELGIVGGTTYRNQDTIPVTDLDNLPDGTIVLSSDNDGTWWLLVHEDGGWTCVRYSGDSGGTTVSTHWHCADHLTYKVLEVDDYTVTEQRYASEEAFLTAAYELHDRMQHDHSWCSAVIAALEDNEMHRPAAAAANPTQGTEYEWGDLGERATLSKLLPGSLIVGTYERKPLIRTGTGWVYAETLEDASDRLDGRYLVQFMAQS